MVSDQDLFVCFFFWYLNHVERR